MNDTVSTSCEPLHNEDPFEALLERLALCTFSFILHKRSFERPGLWVVEWQSRHGDARDEGEIASKGLADVVVLAAAAVARARPDVDLLIPDQIETSGLFTAVQAVGEFGTVLVRLWWNGTSWRVEWECGDARVMIDRRGLVARPRLRLAIDDVVERTIVRCFEDKVRQDQRRSAQTPIHRRPAALS